MTRKYWKSDMSLETRMQLKLVGLHRSYDETITGGATVDFAWSCNTAQDRRFMAADLVDAGEFRTSKCGRKLGLDIFSAWQITVWRFPVAYTASGCS
jgi:hypothetical protein